MLVTHVFLCGKISLSYTLGIYVFFSMYVIQLFNKKFSKSDDSMCWQEHEEIEVLMTYLKILDACSSSREQAESILSNLTTQQAHFQTYILEKL